MRIAYVSIDPGIPVFGTKGASVHVQEVVRELLARGHEVTVWTTRRGDRPPADLAGLPVVELPMTAPEEAGPASGAEDAERRERAQRRASDEVVRRLLADGVDLVYERYSLFSTVLARLHEAAATPGVLEVNAPLVDEHLEALGLTKLARANPMTLSGGEKRRLSVATALISAPELLILDEPTFGQDRGTWLGLVRLLRAALARGVTLVSITHDPAFVAAMGQRVVDLGQVGTRGGAPEDSTDEAGAAPVGNVHDEGTKPGPQRGARGLLARTNPVARVLALLVATTPLLITIDPVSAGVALALELALMPLSGVSARSFFLKATPLLVAAPLGALSMLLYASPGGHVYWQLGPAAISDHSMWLALGIGLRMCAIVMPAIALLDRIDPTDMGDGLAQILHLPARPVLAALAGARMTSLMAADWKALERARRARGVGDASRIRSFLRGSFSLLVFALRRSGKLATTMEARGFGASVARTWARPSRLCAADAALMAVAIAVPTIALALSVWAGTFALVGR